MKAESDIHIRPGVLLAFAETGKQPAPELLTHLKGCATCADSYNLFTLSIDKGRLPTETRDSAFTEHVCPESNKEVALYLMKFLQSGLPAETALPFFRHVNDCDDCFEIFTTNWSAYYETKIRNNFTGGDHGTH